MAPASKPWSGRSRSDAGVVQVQKGRRVLLAGRFGLLAVFFGLVSVMLPAWFNGSVLLVTLPVPVVAALMLVLPEHTLLACAVLVCGLIHLASVPHLPVLGGSPGAADAMLVMLCPYALLALVTQGRRVATTPVAGARRRGLRKSPAWSQKGSA